MLEKLNSKEVGVIHIYMDVTMRGEKTCSNNEDDIFWNPKLWLINGGTGGDSNPLSIIAHELLHKYHEKTDPDAFRARCQTTYTTGPDKRWSNAEEKLTIKTINTWNDFWKFYDINRNDHSVGGWRFKP